MNFYPLDEHDVVDLTHLIIPDSAVFTRYSECSTFTIVPNVPAHNTRCYSLMQVGGMGLTWVFSLSGADPGDIEEDNLQDYLEDNDQVWLPEPMVRVVPSSSQPDSE